MSEDRLVIIQPSSEDPEADLAANRHALADVQERKEKLADIQGSIDALRQLDPDDPRVKEAQAKLDTAHSKLQEEEKALQQKQAQLSSGIKPNGYPQPGASGNTVGIVVPKTESAPPGADSNPPVEAETEEEEAYSDWAKENAQKWLGEYSEPMHTFSDTAMSVGGDVALVGGTVASLGGLLIATGIGAPLGAILVSAGGAIALVGAVATGIGAAASATAHAADAVADAVEAGEKIDMLSPALMWGVGVIENVVTKKADRVLGGGKGGGYVKRKEQPGPRCKLGEYKDGCPSGGTPHHVVPDHVFHEKGKLGRRYPGAPTHGQGLCICVTGKDKNTAPDGSQTKGIKRKGIDLRYIREVWNKLADHGKIHLLVDVHEARLAYMPPRPNGVTTLGKMEKAGASAASRVTGCNRHDLEDQLRAHHKKLGLEKSVLVRADPMGLLFEGNPPYGIMGKRDQIINRSIGLE
ncbi:MAG: hypothetical protein LBI92_02505 [Azoarcus sp.]|jgi:hypothetical protein|nr:hypothetical protein [Azoarcus sp.]